MKTDYKFCNKCCEFKSWDVLSCEHYKWKTYPKNEKKSYNTTVSVIYEKFLLQGITLKNNLHITRSRNLK